MYSHSINFSASKPDNFPSRYYAAMLLSAVAVLFFASPSHAQQARLRNGLAPVMTDSFVRQAGASAEAIYGDESAAAGRGEMQGAPPSYFGFSREHRIDSGIVAQRADGLTTGHGSYLPSAWGRDEFLGAEWAQSGASSATQQSNENYEFVTPQE